MELAQRVRKVDVSKMKKEEIDNLSVQIGEKCRQICDEAAVKINTILAVYGMEAVIAYQIKELPVEQPKTPKAPSKKAKKAKTANLK